jgi:hypothetical protein
MHVTHLSYVGDVMQSKIKFVKLDGSMSMTARDHMIDAFTNDSDTKVWLCPVFCTLVFKKAILLSCLHVSGRVVAFRRIETSHAIYQSEVRALHER